MALIKCIDCGGNISDQAKACIHCGRPTHAQLTVVKSERHKLSQDEDGVNSNTAEQPVQRKSGCLFALMVALSIITDLADLAIAGACVPLDILSMILHYSYAGPVALFALADCLPGLGFLPIFTIMAFCYSKTKDR